MSLTARRPCQVHTEPLMPPHRPTAVKWPPTSLAFRGCHYHYVTPEVCVNSVPWVASPSQQGFWLKT